MSECPHKLKVWEIDPSTKGPTVRYLPRFLPCVIDHRTQRGPAGDPVLHYSADGRAWK